MKFDKAFKNADILIPLSSQSVYSTVKVQCLILVFIIGIFRLCSFAQLLLFSSLNLPPPFVILLITSKVFQAPKALSDSRSFLPPLLFEPHLPHIKDNTFTYTVPALTACHIVLEAAEPVVYGDLNNDSKVNAVDIMMLKRYILGIIDNINLTAADIYLTVL